MKKKIKTRKTIWNYDKLKQNDYSKFIVIKLNWYFSKIFFYKLRPIFTMQTSYIRIVVNRTSS